MIVDSCCGAAIPKLDEDLSDLVPAALDAVSSGVVIIDREYRLVHCNRHVLEWLKRSREEMLGRPCYQLIHREQRPCADCPSTVAFESGEVAHAEHTGLDADGDTTYVEITAYPVKDATGSVRYVIEHAKDISERVAHERESGELMRALRESELRYRTMIEHSNDLIWTLDRDANFIWFNHVAEEVSGYALADWRGKSFAPLIDPEDLPVVQRIFAETMAGKAQSYEVRVRQKEGAQLVLSVNTAPFYADQEVVGTVSFGRDITERRRNEERARALYQSTDEELKRKVMELEVALGEARRSRAKLLAVERLRDDFMHMVSHDLRSPLNSVALHTEVLRRCGANDEERRQRSIQGILQSTKSMDGMITDLVESARLQSGQLELRSEPTSVSELLADIVEGLAPPEQQRIQLSCAASLPQITADRARLGRAIGNLIGNAIKYSPPEQLVQVRAEATSHAVIVEVSDKGHGIPAEDLPHLFERFYRSSAHRGFAGIGLGLHIARLIVVAHGGSISVVSRVGRGSTFAVTLPASNGP